MKPILASDACGSVLNDSWIADYLSIEYSLAHEIDCTKTVYKNIQQLLPGHCFKLNKQGIHIIKYWNPVTTPELKFKTDSEYEEAFREVFFKQ